MYAALACSSATEGRGSGSRVTLEGAHTVQISPAQGEVQGSIMSDYVVGVGLRRQCVLDVMTYDLRWW